MGKKNSLAILCTGGLDSLFLTYLARGFNPHLFFGAIDDPHRTKYNLRAIARCRDISRILGVKFSTVKINLKEYAKSLPKVSALMDKPVFDEDLPAVYVLFSRISKTIKPNSIILSGMGNNEIFNLSDTQLKKYLSLKAPIEVAIHQRIAESFKLIFYPPFLEPTLINHIRTLKKRKNRAILKDYLISENILPETLISQKTEHSSIPASFLSFICRLYKSESFKEAVTWLWKSAHCYD